MKISFNDKEVCSDNYHTLGMAIKVITGQSYPRIPEIRRERFCYLYTMSDVGYLGDTYHGDDLAWLLCVSVNQVITSTADGACLLLISVTDQEDCYSNVMDAIKRLPDTVDVTINTVKRWEEEDRDDDNDWSTEGYYYHASLIQLKVDSKEGGE